MLLLLQDKQEDAFCVEINYTKDSNPSSIFQSMSEIITAFENFDVAVANTISLTLEPHLILEQVETGSIRTWLIAQVKDIDDESLKRCDYKAIIGKLLVKAKYKFLNLLGDDESIDQNKVEAIQKTLNDLIQETEIKHIPAYGTVSKQIIAETYIKTARSVSLLSKNDNVSFHCTFGQVKIERQTQISEEILENLVVAKKDMTEEDAFLKIKKPDYLGDSRWLFHLDKHPIEAKMDDKVWIESFRNRRVVLRPRDSLQVRLKIEIRFDEEGNPLPTQYTVIKVYKIIQGTDKLEMQNLFD